MDNDIFVYYASLPRGVNEMVVPCIEGYTVYIDEQLDDKCKLEAYSHALNHIKDNDFEKNDVQKIESKAHQSSH